MRPFDDEHELSFEDYLSPFAPPTSWHAGPNLAVSWEDGPFAPAEVTDMPPATEVGEVDSGRDLEAADSDHIPKASSTDAGGAAEQDELASDLLLSDNVLEVWEPKQEEHQAGPDATTADAFVYDADARAYFTTFPKLGDLTVRKATVLSPAHFESLMDHVLSSDQKDFVIDAHGDPAGLRMPLTSGTTVSATKQAFFMLAGIEHIRTLMRLADESNTIWERASGTDLDKWRRIVKTMHSTTWHKMIGDTWPRETPLVATVAAAKSIARSRISALVDALFPGGVSGKQRRVDRLITKMLQLQAKGIREIQFRSCNLGKDSGTLHEFRRFFGADHLCAPDVRSGIGQVSPSISQRGVDALAKRRLTQIYDMPSGRFAIHIEVSGRTFNTLCAATTQAAVREWVAAHLMAHSRYRKGTFPIHFLETQPRVFALDTEYEVHIRCHSSFWEGAVRARELEEEEAHREEAAVGPEPEETSEFDLDGRREDVETEEEPEAEEAWTRALQQEPAVPEQEAEQLDPDLAAGEVLDGVLGQVSELDRLSGEMERVGRQFESAPATEADIADVFKLGKGIGHLGQAIGAALSVGPPSPAADVSVAVPEFNFLTRLSMPVPLLSAAANAKAVQWNGRHHPATSGVHPRNIRTDVARYVNLTAIVTAIQKFNAANPTKAIQLGTPPMDGVLVEGIHQFQAKCFFEQGQIDGMAGESTLDSLGLVKRSGMNSVDKRNTQARARLGKVDVPGLTGNEFNADTWFDHMANPSFLGWRFLTGGTPRGVHLSFMRKLRIAERALLAQSKFAGKTPVELGKALGFNATTEEHKGARPTVTSASMHTYGLAVDIKYTGNPWVQGADFLAALKRSALLMSGVRITQTTSQRFLHDLGADTTQTTAAIFDLLAQRNRDFRDYLALSANAAGLTAALQRRRAEGTSGVFSAAESIADAAHRWRTHVQNDLRNMRAKASAFGTRDPLLGFLNLDRDLVIALRDSACLAWGAVDIGSGADGSGDMMHFDDRVCGIGHALAGVGGNFQPRSGDPCVACRALAVSHEEADAFEGRNFGTERLEEHDPIGAPYGIASTGADEFLGNAEPAPRRRSKSRSPMDDWREITEADDEFSD